MKAVTLALSLAAAALAGLATAAPASAQGQYYGPANQGYGVGYQAPRYSQGRGYYRPSFNGQADVPGDYRCDRFWDANRTDCGARWRDQRRSNTGYGHGYRSTYRQGYGRGYGYARAGYGAGGASVYPGAYGRPDLVYPGGGYSGGHGQSYGRDPGRIAWCRSAYRSYDPSSGYYRAYSGRLVFCG